MTHEKKDQFLHEVERLLNECDRRREVVDLSVTKYMIRRIRSCKNALKTIETGQVMITDVPPLFHGDKLNELLLIFSEIEGHWVAKKHAAEDRGNVEGTSSLAAHVERSGKKGRPRFAIDDDQVINLKTLGFTNEAISQILQVSRTTLWRRMGSLQDYSDVSDAIIDEHVTNIKSKHPDVGERILEGMLRSEGINIQRRRLRASIHRVDPVNTALRWMRSNPRCVYSVPGPNSLWHNDGLHKLIRWGFVVHACIDGYSRLATSLLCATNNRTETCLQGFLKGVDEYGLPERVRGDNGTENNGIENYINGQRGGGSYIRGPSVHNQRIERLHYDTTHAVLSLYIRLFKFLEEQELLSADDIIDLFALHFVYTRRIRESLDEFRGGWNLHRLSTCNNKTPTQVWMSGMMDSSKREQIAVQSCIERDWSTFGIELNNILPCDDDDEGTVVLHDVTIGDEEQHVLATLHQEFQPEVDDGNYGIETYSAVRDRIREMLA